MKRAKEDANLPKIHIFSTFFYLNMKTKGYASVRRWSKKFDVFSLDYIIIPVHLRLHWVCAVINFKLKRFEYYDSLHGSNQECLDHLREYVEEEYKDKKKSVYDTSGWSDYMPKNVPNQENGYDCGVFTCMFMEFSSVEEPFAFRQKHMKYMRQRIAHEIMSVQLMDTK